MAQFEEASKLCPCILTAVDQEQADIKKDKELQQQIYITLKTQLRN